MSVAARMAQFPDEPFEECLELLNQPMMWCLACRKPVAHQIKSFVASHLTRQCHITGKAHIAKPDWFVSMCKPRCSFVHAEAVRHPWKGEADARPILHQIDEVMQKRPSGTFIPLSFVIDHTTCLMKCLSFAQGEGPTACYMYDKLMDLVQDWKDTLQQAKLSPRIEDSLKVLKNGENLRTCLLSIVQEMATALDERLVKGGLQLEF